MVAVALTGIVGIVAIVAIVFGRQFSGWFGQDGAKIEVGKESGSATGADD